MCYYSVALSHVKEKVRFLFEQLLDAIPVHGAFLNTKDFILAALAESRNAVFFQAYFVSEIPVPNGVITRNTQGTHDPVGFVGVHLEEGFGEVWG